MGSYTIGALARAAEVSVETVRFYERRGILEQPERGDGYRQYSDDDLRRLQFVRRAKDLGFTLREIGELAGGTECDVLAASRAKLAEIDRQRADLDVRRERLARLVEVCEDGDEGCGALRIG